MNACAETIPSQLPINPVPQHPVAQGESTPARLVPGGSPAAFHSAPTNPTITMTKRSWFSFISPRARNSQAEEGLRAALPVGNLPGVGQTHAKMLAERGVTTVGQLRRIPKPVLVAAFGKGIGQHIWESARS
jgi:hypothetical protein